MTSSPQSNPTPPALRPELKRVLGSLTVHLDDELLRYRRQMRGQAPMAGRRIQPPRSHKSLDLISVPAQSVAGAGATAAGSVPPVPPPPPPPHRGRPMPPPPPPNPFLKKPAQVPAALLADDLAESASPPLAAAPDASSAGTSPAAPAEAPATPTASPPVPEANPELAIHHTQTNPDSYLESSEALLKSLADEADLNAADADDRPPTPYNPNGGKSSLPLKLGSLLLLLTASAAVGYAIINPAVLDP
ncbi:MAG: hypothetical protein AAFZ80_08875, partial [Cyanobacteria bacterium P01_A01_bin.105]